jgi:hypothetical protein
MLSHLWCRRLAALSLGGLLVHCAAPTPRVASAPVFHAVVSELDANLREQMHASWRPGCPVSLDQLRIIKADHFTFAGSIEEGAIIVNADAAEAARSVLEQLFAARYPIAKMVPIDAYDGDDDRSMAANNSSGFNCREVADKKGVWSQHAYGRAIDLNPIQNPYVKGGTASPPEGTRFLDRTLTAPGVIHEGDEVVKAFDAVGWHWGGRWQVARDYQHFSPTNR